MSREAFANEVINSLENAVRGRQILIVGPPYSGRSKILDILAHEISNRQRNWIAFSSGSANALFSHSFYERLVATLKRGGCLDPEFNLGNKPSSLTSFFIRMDNALYKENIRHLVILVDNLDEELMSLEDIANILSTVRGFYTEWNEIEINIHFVFVGKVNLHNLLKLYKGADGASWPLLQGKTVFNIPPLTTDEVRNELLQTASRHDRSLDLYANYLFELTCGDVLTLSNTLKMIDDRKVSCHVLFDAAENLITNSEWIKIIEKRMRNLSTEAIDIVTYKLSGQFISLLDRELKQEIILSGLMRTDDKSFMVVTNPVIERTLRKHWQNWFPGRSDNVFSDISELIPPIFTLNKKAFELISEIEMLLRNTVVVRLGVHTSDSKKHLLSGLNYEFNNYNELKEDQYMRSKDWRHKVGKSRFVDAHAALISYTDTKDILGLIDYLISVNDQVVSSLKLLRDKLSGLKEIRDAVMHGQVINEQSVENLIDIYNDLNNSLLLKIE